MPPLFSSRHLQLLAPPLMLMLKNMPLHFSIACFDRVSHFQMLQHNFIYIISGIKRQQKFD